VLLLLLQQMPPALPLQQLLLHGLLPLLLLLCFATATAAQRSVAPEMRPHRSHSLLLLQRKTYQM
jgi:hypothetical protein